MDGDVYIFFSFIFCDKKEELRQDDFLYSCILKTFIFQYFFVGKISKTWYNNFRFKVSCLYVFDVEE